MPPADALYVDVIPLPSALCVRLEGVFNEDNRLLERVPPSGGQQQIIVRLEGVSRISSSGVRDWVKWVQKQEEAGNHLYFMGCSPVVVAQVNMIANFAGARGQVVSFQAPYFCSHCDREVREAFFVDQLGTEVQTAPELLCDQCGEALEFDDLEATYFAFLKAHATRPVDSGIKKLVQQLVAAPKSSALHEVSSGGLSGHRRDGGSGLTGGAGTPLLGGQNKAAKPEGGSGS